MWAHCGIGPEVLETAASNPQFATRFGPLVQGTVSLMVSAFAGSAIAANNAGTASARRKPTRRRRLLENTISLPVLQIVPAAPGSGLND
jgi:hypothetical protein